MDVDTGRAARGEDDDRLLIRQFQSGDTSAGDELFRRYKGSLVKACDDYGKLYPWLGWSDRWGAAQEAFTRAITDFDLSRNNGINAYARHKVEFALQHVLEDRLRNGMSGGDSRAGRWLSGDWDNRKDLPLEEIAVASKVSTDTAFEALEGERFIREGTVYDTVGESGYDFATEPAGPGIGIDDAAAAQDDDEDRDDDGVEEVEEAPIADVGSLGADNRLDQEVGDSDGPDEDQSDDYGANAVVEDANESADNDYSPLNDAEWTHYCRQRANAKAQDHPGPHAKSELAPLKQVSRARFERDQETAFRHQLSPIVAAAKAGTVAAGKHRVLAGSKGKRAEYERAVEIRLAGYELDCQTFERERLAGRAFGNTPERVERPRAGEPTWEGLKNWRPQRSRIGSVTISLVAASNRRFKKVDRYVLAAQSVAEEHRRIAARSDESQYRYHFTRTDDRPRINIKDMPEASRREWEQLKATVGGARNGAVEEAAAGKLNATAVDTDRIRSVASAMKRTSALQRELRVVKRGQHHFETKGTSNGIARSRKVGKTR